MFPLVEPVTVTLFATAPTLSVSSPTPVGAPARV
jgi:hypothetical protein